ncbi:3-beta hydroxysteroid dehydrogenase [Thioclava sp. SK-1]|uniref:complex I NDUFA9 subunit family protein n=1 Tax=Thioclava sp. SK-1 TaxID=1889770 RepID=UPI0008262833|nr:complex I NDUFA9 subunit family protein [Thioclava sp. SK-1]OCX61690.1 3-beta hydroxysteroid dehydrogenase [Thioclava sp. SK-1]
MSKLVTIYGGSGFVGRYITRRMAKEGWRIRVAVRRPNEATFVKPYGAVGQVEPVLCNIRDDASVAAAMVGADAVINCVGILNAQGKNSFGAIQAEGAGRVARLAAQEGVETLVHMSAITGGAQSDYAKSKALGEEQVLEHFPAATILRPSVMFGTEDQFFNKFAAMTRFSPVLPITGGATKFQPVHVDDVAQVAVLAANGKASGIYELGGPDVMTFKALMQEMLDVIMRRRGVVNLPSGIASLMGGVFDGLQKLTGGLFTNTVLTRDQVKSLAKDNVVSKGQKTFADLGIQPVAMASILPGYLWRFRPHGQYDAIQSSAKNMRQSRS